MVRIRKVEALAFGVPLNRIQRRCKCGWVFTSLDLTSICSRRLPSEDFNHPGEPAKMTLVLSSQGVKGSADH